MFVFYAYPPPTFTHFYTKLHQNLHALDSKFSLTQKNNTIHKKIVVAAEKQHQNLLNGVEHFDKTCMKHTETDEKNNLPPLEGLSF